MIAPASQAALDEILDREDPAVVGIVVSGSVAHGMATEHSDVDVWVVYDDELPRSNVKTAAADEIPVPLAELEQPGRLGTDDWYQRWACAWPLVLRDETGGRVEAALLANATLSGQEQTDVLVDRLDGYVNFAFRAMKAHREARPLERRLDAAESVPWLLDTVFALHGRVRPYNKYLAWELREHPLGAPEWSAETFPALLERMLDGDPDAVREGFVVVERECRAWDVGRGEVLGDTIDGWGEDQLALLRS